MRVCKNAKANRVASVINKTNVCVFLSGCFAQCHPHRHKKLAKQTAPVNKSVCAYSTTSSLAAHFFGTKCETRRTAEEKFHSRVCGMKCTNVVVAIVVHGNRIIYSHTGRAYKDPLSLCSTKPGHMWAASAPDSDSSPFFQQRKRNIIFAK